MKDVSRLSVVVTFKVFVQERTQKRVITKGRRKQERLRFRSHPSTLMKGEEGDKIQDYPSFIYHQRHCLRVTRD